MTIFLIKEKRNNFSRSFLMNWLRKKKTEVDRIMKSLNNKMFCE